MIPAAPRPVYIRPLHTQKRDPRASPPPPPHRRRLSCTRTLASSSVRPCPVRACRPDGFGRAGVRAGECTGGRVYGRPVAYAYMRTPGTSGRSASSRSLSTDGVARVSVFAVVCHATCAACPLPSSRRRYFRRRYAYTRPEQHATRSQSPPPTTTHPHDSSRYRRTRHARVLVLARTVLKARRARPVAVRVCVCIRPSVRPTVVAGPPHLQSITDRATASEPYRNLRHRTDPSPKNPGAWWPRGGNGRRHRRVATCRYTGDRSTLVAIASGRRSAIRL